MQKPRAVKALLFDLGGVIIEIDWDRAFRRWAEFSSLPLEEIRSRFAMDGAYERHERGGLGAAEYFAHLRRVLRLDGDDRAIARGWNSIFTGEISETVDAVLAVRDRLPCYLLSNSNPTHQVVWTRDYPRAMGAFERVFVSSDLGARKPERAAFDAVAERTGVGLDAMLFFDDTLENVEGARAAGLQAVHVRGTADVVKALAGVSSLRKE